MTRRMALGGILTALAIAAFSDAARGQLLTTVRVASGLTNPIFVTAPPGDTSRLFIVEQRGNPSATQARILVMDLTTNPPTLLGTPFLVVSSLATGNEQGLLGMAFDPNYLSNGRFYLNFTQSGGSGTTVIQRRIDSNPLDNVHTDAVGSPNTVISFAQPFTNHNAGWMGFSPVDGYLYIPNGDGGSSCDPSQRAQNLSVVFGKTLRLDVSGATGYTNPPTNPYVGGGGLAEIWNYGLRNPWRCGFDRANGNLYIGDVGQNRKEEIDIDPAGVSNRNYGWDCMEGFDCANLSSQCVGTVNGCTCGAAGLIAPVHDYDQTIGSRCAVTGGYVYRGCRMPGLQGTYFFADYCSGEIWSMPAGGGTVTSRTAELAPGGGLAISLITSFGEDAQGELYICDQSGGEVFKIIPRGVGDTNGDNVVNLNDADSFALACVDPAAYVLAFPGLDPFIRANMNGDCEVNGHDVVRFVKTLVP